MITLSIDVTKIPRDKIVVKKNKAGEPISGKWVDLVLIETPNSKYGNDYFCAVGTTKEERAAGVKGVILGNAKIIQAKAKPAPRPTPAARPRPAANEDDVPY